MPRKNRFVEVEHLDTLMRAMYAEYRLDFLKTKVSVYTSAEFKSGKVPKPLEFRDWYIREFMLILDEWSRKKLPEPYECNR